MHPILFRLGPVTLYSYGFMVALGFCAASFFLSRRSVDLGLDSARIQSIALWALVMGLIGARAMYVFLNWQFFRADPFEILRVHHGGLVFYGGLLAGCLTGVWLLFKNGLLRWQVMDLMMPAVVLAHAFGRVGCFLNGCCYGKPTDCPWAVSFPGEGIPRHPTQLYEAAALLLIFCLLRYLDKKKVRPGTVTFVYGLSYGMWRFAIEFVRGDNPVGAGGLTTFQWMSIFLILLSGIMLFFRYRTAPSR